MFKTVIVGVRDVAHARGAIALARTLAPLGELHLIHAYPHQPAPSAEAKPWAEILNEGANRLLQRTAREVGVAAQLHTEPDRSPAHALQAAAEELQADLIVVGSSHHGRVGRLVAGSVARGVLSGAPCPVAVAPRDHEATRLKTIGVGFDDSPEARIALRVAAAVAKAAGARLRAVQLVSLPVDVLAPMYPLASAPPDWEAYGDREIARARAMIERVVADLLPEVDASGEVALGRPRQELAALTEDVDLLVVGSRGWGPARRVLLGGTSHHLVHHASCPVLVVPRAAEGAEERSAPPAQTTAAGG